MRANLGMQKDQKFWFIAVCGLLNGAIVALFKCECCADAACRPASPALPPLPLFR